MTHHAKRVDLRTILVRGASMEEMRAALEGVQLSYLSVYCNVSKLIEV